MPGGKRIKDGLLRALCWTGAAAIFLALAYGLADWISLITALVRG